MTANMLKIESLQDKEIKRSEVLDIFIPFLKNLSHSFVIALNSPWGTGKTTFVNQCISELGSDYPAIYYNAWKSDYSDDPFIDFCAEVLDLKYDDNQNLTEERLKLLDSIKKNW